MLLFTVLLLAVLVFFSWPGASRGVRITLKIGIALALLSWAPILLAIVLDPTGEVVGNALGLGLLASGGSLLGVLTIAGGLIGRLVARG